MSHLQQSLSLEQINQLRQNLISNLRAIELNKHLLRTHDRTKLVNHHNYALETLDNMINIKQVEMADPYNSWTAQPDANHMLDPRRHRQNVVYRQDGSTSIVQDGQMHTTGEEWEHQFDQRQLLNPPCYSMPPQNLTSIPRIHQASQQSRLNRLTQAPRR